MQHGKSLPNDVDPEQGLSDEGIAESKAVASAAAERGVRVVRILQSGKKGASRTADIFASALLPTAGVRQSDGMNPLDNAVAFAENIDLSEDLMLVGHLPFMERPASFLITGSADKPVIRFKNSGIVCLDKGPEDLNWTIRWTLVP